MSDTKRIEQMISNINELLELTYEMIDIEKARTSSDRAVLKALYEEVTRFSNMIKTLLMCL